MLQVNRAVNGLLCAVALASGVCALAWSGRANVACTAQARGWAGVRGFLAVCALLLAVACCTCDALVLVRGPRARLDARRWLALSLALLSSAGGQARAALDMSRAALALSVANECAGAVAQDARRLRAVAAQILHARALVAAACKERGPATLAAWAAAFLGVTANLYYLLVTLLAAKGPYTSDTPYLALCLALYVLVHLFHIGLLISCCRAVARHANATPIIFNRIALGNNDKHLKTEVSYTYLL